jgi:soluble lytic murein transglycosylase-like protein
MKFLFQLALGLTLVAAPLANASDLAILRNGNSIRHERRQVVGPVTRLYLSDAASGYIEIPTDQIERFETDTTPAISKASAPERQNPAPKLSFPSGTPQTANQQQALVDRRSLDEMVSGAGQRHQIDPDFINSVIRAESGFNNRAVSKKGAQGLMQLMPGTASHLGVANSFDPNSNVEGGTKYLRELLEKYNYDVPKALAAYNAGPGRVDRYRGVPPYFETQTYVAKSIRDCHRKKLAQNPSLAHKSKTTKPKTQTAKAPAPRKRTVKTATANSFPKATESASR